MRSDSGRRAPRRAVRLAPRVAAMCVVAAGLALETGRAAAPHFYPDDPIWVDDDRVADARKAREVKLDDYYDFLENTFGRPGDASRIRAVNVNTLDEVPDSSWFANRIGRREMSIPELVTGPDREVRFSGAWTIVRGKNRGFQPGFRAVDRSDPTGTVYQLEVDPPRNPEMATAAEVIGTAFYHAFGYHTVDVYLTEFDPATIEIAHDATIKDANGRRPFLRSDLDEILKNAARLPNGRVRVSAERFLDGEDMGRFEYHGTRDDDPNDIYPHEHRRELRGSRVFAAWLNHDDSRALNTMVMQHRHGDGMRYLKYYIVDFGSLFGSATRYADGPQSGFDYTLAGRPSLLTLFSLGLYARPSLRQPEPTMHASLGRLPPADFAPRAWVAEYPKAAYRNMREDDAFWAARIVARFSDEAIRAIIAKGRYSDPRAAEALARLLIQRRERIKEVWLTGVNPIVDVSLSPEGTLRFENAAVTHGATTAPEGYALTWSRFDNATDTRSVVGDAVFAREPQGFAPAGLLAAGDYVAVTIATRHPAFPGWKPVQVYFRRAGCAWETVGIDRDLD